MNETKKSNPISCVEDPMENKKFNEIYQTLDEKTKKEIDRLVKPEFKVDVLKILMDQEIQAFYHDLNPKNKQKLESVGIRDRVRILKELFLKDKERKKAKQPLVVPVVEKKEEPLPQEMLEQEEDLEEEVRKKPTSKTAPQLAFQHLVQTYYQSNPFVNSSLNHLLSL
jgi:hypothetical protein